MRLARFEHHGRIHAGFVDGDVVRALSDGTSAVAELVRDRITDQASGGDPIPLAEVTLLPPVDPTSRVFAVAQNYRAHAEEVSGTDVPPSPIIFLKPVSALVGHDAPIVLPPVTSFLDYEAELGIIVGREVQAVEAEAADDAIYGATCFNDVTGRDLQPARLGGKALIDWFSAKSLEASSPVGPWIVTCDELGDAANLAIRCRVNGESVQDDRTSSMVRTPAELISFISKRVTLRPGDLIATGTPGGVGRARGVNLKDSDVVEVEIECIGTLRNRVTEIR